jgi:hypothetical protein
LPGDDLLNLPYRAITNRYGCTAACGPAVSASLPGSGGMSAQPGTVSP